MGEGDSEMEGVEEGGGRGGRGGMIKRCNNNKKTVPGLSTLRIILKSGSTATAAASISKRREQDNRLVEQEGEGKGGERRNRAKNKD